jgi:hypothetical protein
MVLIVKFLLSARIVNHRVQICGQRNDSHADLTHIVPITTHSDAVNVVDMRVLLSGNATRPCHDTSVHIPINVLAPIPQWI